MSGLLERSTTSGPPRSRVSTSPIAVSIRHRSWYRSGKPSIGYRSASMSVVTRQNNSLSAPTPRGWSGSPARVYSMTRTSMPGMSALATALAAQPARSLGVGDPRDPGPVAAYRQHRQVDAGLDPQDRVRPGSDDRGEVLIGQEA